jgi:hypothetical protein
MKVEVWSMHDVRASQVKDFEQNEEDHFDILK